MLQTIVNFILASLTLLGQIFFLVFLIYILFFSKSKNYFSQQGIKLSFIIALVAMLGSLYYSNIIGFKPCDLCWLQRIFMYPQVVLLGLALIKKDSKIIDYSLALAFIGGLISLYHNYVYYAASSVVCGINGVSCTIQYILEFGYITIPIMSLTAFSLIIILLLNQKKAVHY